METKRLKTIREFALFCIDALEIEEKPTVVMINDKDWVLERRSFGEYTPEDSTVYFYVENRNLADILRTLCHELIHHKQNELGHLHKGSGRTGSEIENEANSIAGIVLREYGKVNKLIYESLKREISFEILLIEGFQKYKLYCDMDGVLCDFDTQFEHYFGTSISEYEKEKGSKAMHNAVDSVGIEFWENMPWTPGGKALWDKIGKYEVTILSAPGKFIHAKEGKKKWIEKNLNPKPKNVVFKESGEKHNILKSKDKEEINRSVLIDDYGKNLTPWSEMGGKVVKYRGFEGASNELNKL
jgi:hypothetical protein